MSLVRYITDLDILRRRYAVTLDDEPVEEVPTQPKLSLIESNRAAVRESLDSYAGTELRLISEIAERTEELRQVRVSINALSQADSVLEQGAQQIAAE